MKAKVTPVIAVMGGQGDALPEGVYGGLRGWRDRAKIEAQKKREARAECDRLTQELQLKQLEFDSVFKACLLSPMSGRARAELRRQIKNGLQIVLESEMDEWVKRKVEALKP